MTNNNLPEWGNNAFEIAGVSTDGWDTRPQDFCEDTLAYIEAPTTIYLHRYPEGFTVGFGAVEIYGKPKMCSSQAIQLADRLKRAILNEPDLRVAELEELIQRFYSASSAMLTGISIANDRHGANIKGPVVDNFNKVVNEAKAAFAKAQGEQL